MPKERTFVALRHEIRHFEQNLEYYRCGNLGEQVAKEDAISMATFDKFLKFLKENPNEDNTKLIEKGKEIRKYVSEHPEDEDYISCLKDRLAYRKEAINHMGVINDYSEQGKYIIERYNQKKNNTTFSENYINYKFAQKENEAYLSQRVAIHNLENNEGCLFKKLKENNRIGIEKEFLGVPRPEQQKHIEEIKEIFDKNPNSNINFLNSYL